MSAPRRCVSCHGVIVACDPVVELDVEDAYDDGRAPDLLHAAGCAEGWFDADPEAGCPVDKTR